VSVRIHRELVEPREVSIMRAKVASWLSIGLLLAGTCPPAVAQHGHPEGVDHQTSSADAIAKELANPAGSLASLANNFEYTDNHLLRG
jgi:hypothetical protein